MSDSKTFKGVLTDAEDGEIVVISESPNSGLLLTMGKNKIALWPDQLEKMLEAFTEWQND